MQNVQKNTESSKTQTHKDLALDLVQEKPAQSNDKNTKVVSKDLQQKNQKHKEIDTESKATHTNTQTKPLESKQPNINPPKTENTTQKTLNETFAQETPISEEVSETPPEPLIQKKVKTNTTHTQDIKTTKDNKTLKEDKNIQNTSQAPTNTTKNTQINQEREKPAEVAILPQKSQESEAQEELIPHIESTQTSPQEVTPKLKNIHKEQTKEPTTQKQHKEENTQKSSTQHKVAQTQVSDNSGDSKQHTQSHKQPLTDSQKAQDSEAIQITNEEFLQDLEQSAKNIKHIQKHQELATNKPQILKEQSATQQTQNTAATAQTHRTEVMLRSALARESVRNFASQLSQEVLNYKPPITKLSLELNPQNLGTLELTISKNGNDLQVQVVSNPNAINLFVANQVELRNNLTQVGFNNVDLSFSQQNSSGKGRQNSKNQQKQQNIFQGNESSLESHTMQITIPQYA